MTDAPKMPPFPELPVNTPHLASDLMLYYRDLAAAWEAVARDAVSELQDAFDYGYERSRVSNALGRYAALPPKEG